MVHYVGIVFTDAQILGSVILAPPPMGGRGCEFCFLGFFCFGGFVLFFLSLTVIPVLPFQRTRNSLVLKKVNAVILHNVIDGHLGAAADDTFVSL